MSFSLKKVSGKLENPRVLFYETLPRRLPRPAPPLEAGAEEGNQAKQEKEEEEEGLSGGGGTKRTRGCSCGRGTYVRTITAEKVFFRNMKFKQKKMPS